MLEKNFCHFWTDILEKVIGWDFIGLDCSFCQQSDGSTNDGVALQFERAF